MAMSTSSGSADYGLFDELAEEFAERYRRGERPSLQEYVDRCPAMGDEIRELFPALVEVEQAEEVLEASPRTGGLAIRSGAAPGGRLPGDPRGRPRRDGRGVRGRAGLARPPGGARRSCPASWPRTARRWSGSAARRGPRRGCTTPISCRSSRWARTATWSSTPCSSSRARGSRWSSMSWRASARSRATGPPRRSPPQPRSRGRAGQAQPGPSEPARCRGARPRCRFATAPRPWRLRCGRGRSAGWRGRWSPGPSRPRSSIRTGPAHRAA